MQTAIDTKSGMPVKADGSVAQLGLLDGKPFLHLLPRLWLPYSGLDVCNSHNVRLTSIKIPALGIDICGEDFKPSRPFPNFSYVVFGKDRRMGWMIPLDGPLPELLEIKYVFVLEGKFRTSMGGYFMEVHHKQRLKINDSDIGNSCFSTERCTPVFICDTEYENVFSSRFSDNVLVYGHSEVADGYLVDEWQLETQDSISPLPNRYVHSLEFEDYEPFHSKKQLVELTRFNKEHQSNASLEAPFSLLSAAMKELTSMEYDSANGLPENHPAMRILCDWWNNHKSVPSKLKKAKTCQIYVRINNKDEYQDIDLQVPSFEITDFDEDISECAVRVGDHFLIVYLQGRGALVESPEGTTHFLVNGVPYETCGISADEHFPGNETLKELTHLNCQYSKIVDHYESKGQSQNREVIQDYLSCNELE